MSPVKYGQCSRQRATITEEACRRYREAPRRNNKPDHTGALNSQCDGCPGLDLSKPLMRDDKGRWAPWPGATPAKPGDLADFAGALEAMRMAAGMAQLDLAKAVGVAQVTISGYETGRRRPDRATLDKIDRALGGDLRQRFGAAMDAKRAEEREARTASLRKATRARVEAAKARRAGRPAPKRPTPEATWAAIVEFLKNAGMV